MQFRKTIHSFAVNLGGHPVVENGGWEANERLLVCGNIDGFVRVLHIAEGPQAAAKCMKQAARKGERGGAVNVRHTWRAHTSQITQIKVVYRGEPYKPCFCSASTDGSVKLWGFDGAPVAQLGMTAMDSTVTLISTHFRASAGLSRMGADMRDKS